jgi:hypothetical protein
MYGALSDGTDHPDVGLTTQEVLDMYEAGLVPHETFENKETGDAGFINLTFKNMVLMLDHGIQTPVPTSPTALLPATPLYFLNSKYLKMHVHPDANFSTTPFQTPALQDGRIALILFMGNLSVCNRKRQGVISVSTAENYD